MKHASVENNLRKILIVTSENGCISVKLQRINPLHLLQKLQKQPSKIPFETIVAPED